MMKKLDKSPTSDGADVHLVRSRVSCAKKTAKNNVFYDLGKASEVASRIREQNKQEVRPYKCRACKLYHIGKIYKLGLTITQEWCNKETSFGNKFGLYLEALAEAQKRWNVSKKKKRFQVYKCPICRYWHVKKESFRKG
jgi:hypothetical protein